MSERNALSCRALRIAGLCLWTPAGSERLPTVPLDSGRERAAPNGRPYPLSASLTSPCTTGSNPAPHLFPYKLILHRQFSPKLVISVTGLRNVFGKAYPSFFHIKRDIVPPTHSRIDYHKRQFILDKVRNTALYRSCAVPCRLF